jgi:hypothetical protein
VVSVYKCGERLRRAEISGVNVFVKLAKELDEGVWIAFGVGAGIGGVTARGGTQQSGIFGKQFADEHPPKLWIEGKVPVFCGCTIRNLNAENLYFCGV